MSKKLKRIVCFGGGNAMPKAVLTGLKKYPVKLSVICAMLDSGGSAGRLRKDYKIVSPGDIRRTLIALADTSPAIKELFDYRFQSGELKGHNFANLLITALELSTRALAKGRRRNEVASTARALAKGEDERSSSTINNYEKSWQELKRILNVSHEVFPVTLDKANLYAVLENGKIVFGETNIDIPKHDGNLKIKKVFLKPKAKAYRKAIKAINNADLIVIGPGDLYSSLAQILLTEGIPQAIRKSRAKKVYICNLMTKYGETNNFNVLDFVKEIEKYLGGKIDYVIYNTKKPSSKRLTTYKKQHPELLDLVNGFDEKFIPHRDSSDRRFIGVGLLPSFGPIVHDHNKLTKVILSI